MDYNETALARAAVSRSAGNDQTPTTSRKRSMKKTMKEIRKSLTTALNATLTTPLTPSRSPSPIPRQPLPVRSRPQTERNNSPKPQQYSQSSNRSTNQSPSRTPDQNNRYRNTVHLDINNGALVLAAITVECKIDHATIDIHHKITGHILINSHNHQIGHIQTETGHLASTDNPEEIIRRQEIKAQDNTDQITEEIHIIGHIASIDKMNIDPRHRTGSRILDVNLHIEALIIQEIILTIDIVTHLLGQTTIISRDIDHQPLPNIQVINQELIAVQNTHLGQVCSVKNVAHSEITTNTPAQLTIIIVPTNAPNAKKVTIMLPNAKQNEDRRHHFQATNR
jgi:hypothetical protein